MDTGRPLLDALESRRTDSRVRHAPVVFKPPIDSIDICGWLHSVFSFRGRSLRPILAPVVLVFAVSVLTTIASQTDWFGKQLELHEPQRLEESYSLLLVCVSLLLVFRMNRAAVRYYEARTAAGKMVVASRELASSAILFVAHDPRGRDEVCRWLVAFPVAVRNYLRSDRRTQSNSELGGVLSPRQLQDFANSNRQPVLCADRIRRAVLWGMQSNNLDHFAPFQLHLITSQIDMLQIGMGAMERINETPLPFAYVAHLRTVLIVYLLFMPIVFARSWGWANPIAMAVLAFGMIGIDAVSTTCERPFGLEANHLFLDWYADVVAQDVAQSLKSAGYDIQAIRSRTATTIWDDTDSERRL